MASNFRRKGQIIDVLAYGIAALVIAIAFIFLVFFTTNIKNNLVSSGQLDSSVSTPLNNTVDSLPSVMDYAYAIFIVMSGIVLIAASAFVDTHPIFFGITLLLFFVVILANAVFANVLNQFGTQEALVNTYAGFPIMRFFAGHWLNIIIGEGFLCIIAFFGGKTIR